MADLEKRLLAASPLKPSVWKRFIDDTFSLNWNVRVEEVSIFVNVANSFHPTIKFTCEKSSERVVFLDTEIFRGPGLSTLNKLSIHKIISSPLKLFSIHTCHSATHSIPMRLLRTNSVKEQKRDFDQRPCKRGHSTALVQKLLTDILTYHSTATTAA